MNSKELLGFLGLMVLVASIIDGLSVLVGVIRFQFTLTLEATLPLTEAIYLAGFIIGLPYDMLKVFSIGLLYVLAGVMIQKKKEDGNEKYTLRRVVLPLWLVGIVGTFCTYVIGIFAYLSLPEQNRVVTDPLSLLVQGLPFILLAPFVPVLVVLFQLAYQNLLSSQPQLEEAQQEENIDLSSFLGSPLLKFTGISLSMIVIVQSRLIYVFFYSGLDEWYYFLSYFFTILFYLLMYFITSVFLLREKDLNLKYVLKDTIIILLLFGMLGTFGRMIVGDIIYLVDHLEYILAGRTWVFSTYLDPLSLLTRGIYAFFPPPLALIVIVLFRIAYEKRFSSQAERDVNDFVKS